MSKKIKTKQTKTTAKPILYLHVNGVNKTFFQKTARKYAAASKTRITDSAVADKILTKLRSNSKLLKAVLA